MGLQRKNVGEPLCGFPYQAASEGQPYMLLPKLSELPEVDIRMESIGERRIS